ncbi:MAG: hypothetical protein QG656_1693 [Candidatus Hydrogenedentes bacterium]|nr:hypothetical protein [Candidatus Hydrogenedentota bacterium]
MRILLCVTFLTLLLLSKAWAEDWIKPAKSIEGVQVGEFLAEVHTPYVATGDLPAGEVRAIAAVSPTEVYAATDKGLVRFNGALWQIVPGFDGLPIDAIALNDDGTLLVAANQALWTLDGIKIARAASLPDGTTLALDNAGSAVCAGTDKGLYWLEGDVFKEDAALSALLGGDKRINQIAPGANGEVAVAAAAGLFLRGGDMMWRALIPEEDSRRWALRDVRGAAFDSLGRLWCCSPQGAACLDGDAWKLYTGHEGLPYDDFTAMAADRDGAVWFGTKKGAVHYDGKHWAYRQGRRWLANDAVNGIAVTGLQTWFATGEGVSLIERRPMTLAQKAQFFESEIDTYHRRTPYGYVDSVHLVRPGDKSEWVQQDSDNDGLWTSMYGAGECFAYAATGSADAKRRAKAAFEALRFLGVVTQGGEHPALPGFVARTILPTSGPNPNDGRLEHDRRAQEEDRLWKLIDPRWPTSADGQWYWKSDTSSDELDGHYFFYATYYDLVADTEEERARVREHVKALTDHLVDHDFDLVDWDGQPTRWARYGPKTFNRSSDWWEERGLNSLSILSYLKVAEHVTGDTKYRDAARMLVEEHGYAMNVLCPKAQTGPGSGNQSDDEMAFMSYYNLLKYESDPELRSIYALSLHNYWQIELPELNPLFNFIAAASIAGDTFTDPWGTRPVSPRGKAWLEDSLDTLERYPLDRIDWGLENSHRKDLVPLPTHTREGGSFGKGCRNNGKVLPVDERCLEHYNHDPWDLNQGGKGHTLADGASFLMPYYMGLYHGFLID